MEEKDVSFAAYESAMMHMQRINNRLVVLAGIAIIFAVVAFAGILYFLTHYEVTTEQVDVSSQNGAVNYIGEDNNGDITNVPSDSEENDN